MSADGVLIPAGVSILAWMLSSIWVRKSSGVCLATERFATALFLPTLGLGVSALLSDSAFKWPSLGLCALTGALALSIRLRMWLTACRRNR